MNKPELYQCPECGLHYEDQNIAKQCEAFCKANKACSIEITKYSAEKQGKAT